jgi:hypothetical protein
MRAQRPFERHHRDPARADNPAALAYLVSHLFEDPSLQRAVRGLAERALAGPGRLPDALNLSSPLSHLLEAHPAGRLAERVLARNARVALPDALSCSSPYEDCSSGPVRLVRKKENLAAAREREERRREVARILSRPEVPLEAKVAERKRQCIEKLKERFKDDPKKLRDVLKEMDVAERRMATQKDVKKKNGEVCIGDKERQQQLYKFYDSLCKISDDAGKLKDKKGRVLYTKENVDVILADTIARAAEPKRMFNQGKTKTCALASIDRQDATILGGDYAERIALACTKAQVKGQDRHGRTVTYNLDRDSLRLQGSSAEFSLDPRNKESAAGRIGSVALGQLSLSLYAEERGLRPDTFVYKRVKPVHHLDSGERVQAQGWGWTPKTGFFHPGRVIATNPMMDTDAIHRTKAAIFDKYDKDIARDTTVASAAFAHDRSKVTVIRKGEELRRHLAGLKERGLESTTAITHTYHYAHDARGEGGSGIAAAGRGVRLGGLHATSIDLSDDGKGVDWDNNWGVGKSKRGLNAEQVADWMKPPWWMMARHALPFVVPRPFHLLPHLLPRNFDHAPHMTPQHFARLLQFFLQRHAHFARDMDRGRGCREFAFAADPNAEDDHKDAAAEKPKALEKKEKKEPADAEKPKTLEYKEPKNPLDVEKPRTLEIKEVRVAHAVRQIYDAHQQLLELKHLLKSMDGDGPDRAGVRVLKDIARGRLAAFEKDLRELV